MTVGFQFYINIAQCRKYNSNKKIFMKLYAIHNDIRDFNFRSDQKSGIDKNFRNYLEL